MKKIILIFILGILLISFASASFWDFNKKSFDKDVGKYGKIKIKDWWGIGNLQEITLKENTDKCGNYCNATKEIIMYEDGSLIDDVRFSVLNRDEWVEIEIRDYNFYIIDGKKKTEYELGTEMPAGKYNVLLEGEKNFVYTIDWQILTQGYWSEEWITWNSTWEENLIGYWGQDHPSGTNVQDNSTNSLNGTGTFGTATWGAGRSGNVIQFQGDEQNYVDFGNDRRLAGTNNNTITIHGLLYMDSTTADYQTIYSFSNAGDADLVFVVRSDGKLDFFSDGHGWNAQSTNVVPTGEWVCAGVTANAGTVTYYINGGANGTSTGESWADEAANSGRLGFYGANAELEGKYDMLTLHNVSLSATQMSDLCNNKNGLPFGEVVNIPSVATTLVAPADLAETVNSSLTFDSQAACTNCNVTNVTLHVWNSDDSEFGTNVTLDVTGENNNTNLSISGLTVADGYIWNTMWCGSDGAGLYNCSFASSNRTFDVKTYEINDETWSNTTIEGDVERFEINVTTFSEVNVSTADLIYNGTIYSGTITNPSTDFYSISTSFEIPAVSSNQNHSLYWNLVFNDSSEQNTTERNQTAYAISLTICDASVSTPYINFSFRDEASNNPLNATIDSSTWTYWSNNASNNKTYSYANTTDDLSNFAFCFTPQYRNISVDLVFQYSNTSYPQRTYSPATLSLTNITTNTTLYLLPSSDGIYVTFQVVNSADQPIDGVSVNATRSIGGSTVVVGQGETGADGGVTFWLNPDFSHTFSFSKTGYTTYTTSLTPTQSSYTITLGSSSAATEYDFSRGISYSIVPSGTYLSNDTTYGFNLTLSSSYWSLDSFGFTLKLENGSILGSDSSTSDTGGTINIDQDTENFEEIIMDFFWNINDTYSNSTRMWLVYDVSDTSFSIYHFFTDLSLYVNEGDGFFGMTDFGLALLSFAFIFISVGFLSNRVGVGNIESVAMALIFSLVWLFDVKLGIIPNPPLAAAAGVSNFPTIFVGLIMAGIIVKEAMK